MRRQIALICAALSLTACASTAIKPTDFEAIRPIEPQTGSALDISLALLKAQEDYENERYNESYDGFQLAALKSPDNLAARIGWGNAAIALNLFEKAYEIFSNKFGLDTAREEEKYAHLAGLVLAEVATGRVEDEEVRLNEALEYNLHDIRLWNALGQFHDKQKNWVPAQRTYLKALYIDPKAKPSVINNLGMSFLKQGQYNMALEKFQQAATLKPKRGLYDNNRRLTLVLMRDYDAAIDNLPQDKAADIFNDAGFIALNQKKYDMAESLISRAIDLSPAFNAKAELNLSAVKSKLNAIKIQDKMVLGTERSLADWGEYVFNP